MKDEYKIMEKDCYCECYSCGKRISIGDEFRYTTSGYTTYCADFDCIDGVATEGSNLGYEWFDEENIIWEQK